MNKIKFLDEQILYCKKEIREQKRKIRIFESLKKCPDKFRVEGEYIIATEDGK